MNVSDVLKDHGIGGNLLRGDATTADVLSGKTFSNATSNKNTGTMANRGAVTITPSTVNQAIPQGYHNGSGIVQGDADLVATNIKNGVNIFGVVGSVIEGNAWASGTASTDVNGCVTVSGLSFTPKTIIINHSYQKINNIMTFNYNSSTNKWAYVNVNDGTHGLVNVTDGGGYVTAGGFKAYVLPIISANNVNGAEWIAFA